MEQNKHPVQQYYYSESEWDRLGCGPLPLERRRENLIDVYTKLMAKQLKDITKFVK